MSLKLPEWLLLLGILLQELDHRTLDLVNEAREGGS